VPLDSIADVFSRGAAPDSVQILSTTRALESRFDSAAKALGVPAVFPEGPLDALGQFALSVKFPGLAATLLGENRTRYPHLSNAHESFGEALAALGDTARAVTELRTALAIARDSLAATASIITRTHERGVVAAASSRLRQMHRAAT